MGLEPTTSELEVQRASPLRHSGRAPIDVGLRLKSKGYLNLLRSGHALNSFH